MTRCLPLVATLVLGAGIPVSLVVQATTPLQPETAAPAAVLVAWNQRLLSIADAEDHFLTLKGVRAAAMMHLAIHDALQAIHPRYASYAYDTVARDAEPTVAAAQAGYAVVLALYPSQHPQLREELRRWLDPVADGAGKADAIALGQAAAAAVIARRTGDGWDGEAAYQWRPIGPGVYAEFRDHSGTPEGFVFGAAWAGATPFTLTTADQFRAPPPPAIESDAYTRAFDEVRSVGRDGSTTRTPDQSHLAMWWKDFAENSHNRLARQLVTNEHTDLWAAARMFALLNMGLFDSYVSVFANKFHHNHWRPFTAIRQAASDGNPHTQPDAEWNNLHRHTYAFPSYPSAHGTVCAAAMTVLADTYGDRHPFTMHTPEVDSAGPLSPKLAMDPPTRAFDSFSAAAMECALSRVYLGIHFRYDSIAGNRLGQQVGHHAVATFLAPRR